MKSQTRSKGRYYSMALVATFMLFVSVAGMLWINEAQAIRISMKRVIFEGPKRSDIITIMNNTASEQVYRLGWRHYRMDERKSLVNIDDNPEEMARIKWADDMIRFAPRRVVVPPGSSQQIRVLLRRPRDLEPGEYRAHLWIVTEREAEEFAPDDESAGGGESSFRLSMLPAITMPMFVRHGKLDVSASITDVSMGRVDGEHNEVGFTLNRIGNRSLYGDIKIICTAGSDEFVGHFVRGIAVYTEVDKRFFNYDISFPPERANDCSTVRIEYTADRNDSQYAGQVMAQATASLR